MLGEEPKLHEYGVPSNSWNDKAATYKGLQRRTELPRSFQELSQLQANDIADWVRRASEDDGVSDPNHLLEHAEVRRTGSKCVCPSQGGATKTQLALTAAVNRSTKINVALANARVDAKAREVAGVS